MWNCLHINLFQTQYGGSSKHDASRKWYGGTHSNGHGKHGSHGHFNKHYHAGHHGQYKQGFYTMTIRVRLIESRVAILSLELNFQKKNFNTPSFLQSLLCPMCKQSKVYVLKLLPTIRLLGQ